MPTHYITVPINANGIVFDPTMNNVVVEAMSVHPFGFGDVVLYSHGWSTDADAALDLYNQFSVELAKLVLNYALAVPSPFTRPPANTLGVGIHWPSEITEDPTSPLNNAQLLTFYTMEQRADAVGKNAVYAMLRLILAQRVGTAIPLRLYLLGHSFGCKVILSALQDLQTDIAGGTIVVPPGTEFYAVLLEAATDNDNLEPGDIYGSVSQIAGLKVLLSTSQLDAALGTWFPLAGKLANIVHAPLAAPPQALGHAGPTAATAAAFGGSTPVVVTPGFTMAGMGAGMLASRLIVADLTPVHQARVNAGAYPGGGFAGSHSDISFAEVYELVAGFFYG